FLAQKDILDRSDLHLHGRLPVLLKLQSILLDRQGSTSVIWGAFETQEMGGTYAERSGRSVCLASILGKCRNAQPNQQAQENHGRAAGQSVSRRVVLRDMRVFHILSDVGVHLLSSPIRKIRSSGGFNSY